MGKSIPSFGKASYCSKHSHESAFKICFKTHTVSSYFSPPNPFADLLVHLHLEENIQIFSQLYNYIIKHKQQLNISSRRLILCIILWEVKTRSYFTSSLQSIKSYYSESSDGKVVKPCCSSIKKSRSWFLSRV